MADPLHLDVDRAALCVVEMQNDIVHESNIGRGGLGEALATAVQARGVVDRLARLLAAARPRGVPVLYVNVANKPGFPRPNAPIYRLAARRPLLLEGTWGAQVHERLAPRPEDFVLERTVGVDGSYGTQLYPVLRMLRRSTLLMSGVSTNIAVEGIVRASVNRGFDVIVVEDCCASHPEAWHRFSIENIMPLLATVTSSAAALDALGPPA